MTDKKQERRRAEDYKVITVLSHILDDIEYGYTPEMIKSKILKGSYETI